MCTRAHMYIHHTLYSVYMCVGILIRFPYIFYLAFHVPFKNFIVVCNYSTSLTFNSAIANLSQHFVKLQEAWLKNTRIVFSPNR